MGVKLAVTGSVVAGLLAVGGVAAVAAFQPVPQRQVEFVSPASVVSTPTVELTVEPTAAPVVVPTTVAPAPVESVEAPAPVVAPKPEVIMPKVVEPAPQQPAPQQPEAVRAGPGVRPTDGTLIRRAAPDNGGNNLVTDTNGNMVPNPNPTGP